MASRIKQVASQQVAALARKNDEKEQTNAAIAFSEFNPYTYRYTDTGTKSSLTNALEMIQAINYRMALDQEFVISFLKQYADTSILRNVPTMSTFSSPPTDIDSSVNNVQHELAMVSAHLATDILALSIRTNLPMTLIKREYIRYKRRKRIQSMPRPKCLLPQLRIHKPPPPIRNESCLTGKVNGLPNYSSTCFFNSVLQALASVTPFIRYLERIVHIETGLEGMGMSISRSRSRSHSLGFFSKKQPLSRLLLEIIMYINNVKGYADKGVVHQKIRQILDRIASENEQFKSYKYHHSKEQQDAQELLQALIALIVEESGLEDNVDDEENTDVNEINGDAKDTVAGQSGPPGDSSLFSLSELYEEEGVTTLPLAGVSHSGRNTEASLTTCTSDAVLDGEKEEKKDGNHNDDAATDANVTNTVTDSDPEKMSAPSTRTRSCIGIKTKQSKFSKSIQIMVTNLSSKTPSPLSGCIGSTLQCCDCKHVRRINESPFLEIPVVPTAVSKRMGIGPGGTCRLEDCLKEFTEAERVQGVNCRTCSIQAELGTLKEEKDMLREAIDNISARGCDESETLALSAELKGVCNRCEFLMSIDPDEDVERNEEDFDVGEDNLKSIPAPRKADHEKKLILTRLPPVLCLHVKRLYFNPATNQMSKSTQHIDFQEYLDLKDLYAGSTCSKDHSQDPEDNPEKDKESPLSGTMQYKLMSVIEHRGNAFSGHYVTYRRVVEQTSSNCLPGRPASADWAFVSDETISFINWNDVRQCNAYMLIYEAI